MRMRDEFLCAIRESCLDIVEEVCWHVEHNLFRRLQVSDWRKRQERKGRERKGEEEEPINAVKISSR
jgi:hypothetical protein